jgi:Trk K+ transport system NAD-binding subunit
MTEPSAPIQAPRAGQSGHVIVCGLGHLGQRTIDELRSRYETVVAVGADDEAEESLASRGVRLVVGDARLPRVLLQAEVASAGVIVLTSDDDLGNLNTALAATGLNPGLRVVIRLFDQEVGARIPELFDDAIALSASAVAAPGFVSAALDGETGNRFRLAGRVLSSRSSEDPARAARSIPIARLAADRTVELLPDPGTAGDLIVVDVAEEPAGGATSVASPTSAATASPGADEPRGPARSLLTRPLAAIRTQMTAPQRRLLTFGAVLLGLAVASAIYFYAIAGLSPLDAVTYAITLLTGSSVAVDIGDAASRAPLRMYAILLSLIGAVLVAIVYAFITDALIRSRLLETLGVRSVPADVHDHVIVAGLGSIGYRVAQGVAARGVRVVAVDVAEDGPLVSPARAAGMPVVIGDARSREVLEGLGLGRARALVVATSDDLVNLAIALNARAARPDLRVVLRLFDPEFALRVQRGFGIRFTRSVSHLAAPAFAAAAIRSEVVATVPVGDRRLMLFARLRVPEESALIGRLASTLDQAGAVRLLAVADPGSDVARWEIPPDEVLEEDEEIIVAATREGLGELHRLATTPGAGRVPASERAAEGGKDAGDIGGDEDDEEDRQPAIIDRAEFHPATES